MKKHIDKYKDEIINQFRKELVSTDDIITKVVDVSTIRAYRDNNKYQPLSMYRVWAQENLTTNKKKKDLIIYDNDFDNIHLYFSEDLQKFWKKHDGKKLDKIYKVYKIVDLFFKGITLWKELNKTRRKFYFDNVHSPLDQYSMKFLKKYSSELKIPDDVSMSFIQNDKNKYFDFQNEIKRISKDFNITPYLFDEIAWRVGHSESRNENEYKLIKIKTK